MTTDAFEWARKKADESDTKRYIFRALGPRSEADDYDLVEYSRNAKNGNLVYCGPTDERGVALPALLDSSSAYVTAPPGRGKSGLIALLARELLDKRPVVGLSARSTSGHVWRDIASAQGDRKLARRVEASCEGHRAIVTIDDWEACHGKRRHQLLEHCEQLQSRGHTFLFLSAANVAPPPLSAMQSLRLLPFTPFQRTTYVYSRFGYPAKHRVDDVVRRLSPLSGEAFYLVAICDYFDQIKPSGASASLVEILRRIVRQRLTDRWPLRVVTTLIACLRKLALGDPTFSLVTVASVMRELGEDPAPAQCVALLCEAGLLAEKGNGTYEFSHSLWRAAVVVDAIESADDSGVLDFSFVVDPALRRSVARLAPLAKMSDARRNDLLSNLLESDFRCYVDAIRTLDLETQYEDQESAVRSYVLGVNDIASRMSAVSRSMIEPWAGYPTHMNGAELGAVYDRTHVVLRLRDHDEPFLIASDDARESEYAPDMGYSRGSSFSRKQGAALALDQLQGLWRRGILPLSRHLAKEQLYAWATQLLGERRARRAKISDLLQLAGDCRSDLLLEGGVHWVDGADAARHERLHARDEKLISGEELLALIQAAEVGPSTQLKSLAHPMPRRRPAATQFRVMYSATERLARLRSVMSAAALALTEMIEIHFRFLRNCSPFRCGPVRLRISAIEPDCDLLMWWEPTNGDTAPRIDAVPPALAPSVLEIERQAELAAAALGRDDTTTITSGSLIDWDPNSAPATDFVCDLLQSFLRRGFDGFRL